MKLVLFGAEIEESLALRYLHAAAVKAGHQAELLGFREPEEIEGILQHIVAAAPDVVGLSMVFTANAIDFVRFAAELRRRGYRGHLTAGGQFASLHAKLLLEDAPAIDSVLHGEGEEAIVDLLDHLHEPERVLGLTRRLPDGSIVTSALRPLEADLDSKPWPTRPEVLDRYLGLPIASMLGSRGCFAACRFCSIASWSQQLGGPRFRQRAPSQLAAEMAELYHRRGVRLFNFHDDNFFLPQRAQTLARLAELRGRLEGLGVGRIGIQVKSRPDTVDPEVVAALKALGCFRVFLGVESNSVKGLAALGRGIRHEQNHRALRLLLEAGLHVSFNLLAFEPRCTLDDLRANIAFIRQYPEVPLNVARTEVYGGTALERELAARGALRGSYFGYDYALADPGSQRVFEIFREVFRERNFTGQGANLRAMAVDYQLQLFGHFWPERVDLALVRRVKGLIRRVNESNAGLLERACDFAASGPDAEETKSYARELNAERREADGELVAGLDALLREIERLSAASPGDPATPGFQSGRATTTAALIVAVVAIAGVGLITLFGDNIRRLFGASTELAGEMAPARVRPSDGGTKPE